jgi:endonuclease YncB( thermonuclease family)
MYESARSGFCNDHSGKPKARLFGMARFSNDRQAPRAIRRMRIRLAGVFCLATICALYPLIAAAGLSAEVIGILGGDIIDVSQDHRTERVRLHGIDCPEKNQAFGRRAGQATSALIFGKEITMKTHGKDEHGHTVADVILPDGTNVNQQLVREGWCWWYPEDAPKDLALKQSEQEAKRERKGLWADPDPVPPWLYRRLHSGAYP